MSLSETLPRRTPSCCPGNPRYSDEPPSALRRQSRTSLPHSSKMCNTSNQREAKPPPATGSLVQQEEIVMTPDIGLGNWLYQRALRAPHRKALTFEGTTWTYAQLQDRIDRLASALRTKGICQ